MVGNIHELPKATVHDAARVLRSIADEIEAGAYGTTIAGALVLEENDGTIRTFGMASAEYYRAIALFHLGIENLLAKRGREFMA